MRSFLQSVGLCAKTLIQASVLMLALLPQAAMADPAPGGTLIRNIAQTTYFNAGLGLVETVYSNPVEATVLSVPDIEVTGYSELVLTRGAMAQYYFEVLNTGNVPLDAQMTVQDRIGAGLTGAGQLVADLNGNGLIDANEPAFDISAPFPLMPGQRLQLIYEFRVSQRPLLS